MYWTLGSYNLKIHLVKVKEEAVVERY